MQRRAQSADDLWIVGNCQVHVQSLAEQSLQARIESYAPGKYKALLNAHTPDHTPDAVHDSVM